MPNSRVEYLSVTFLEDVPFDLLTVPAGTTISLQKDIARGLNARSVVINGAGSSATAPTLGLLGGASAPVTVSGTPGIGNTLTAVLATGWTVTGYQWMRDGSAISGATASTYLQVTADGGHVITLSVSGLVYTPPGVTCPPGGGGPTDIWDDTQTWTDISIWTD